MSYEKRDDEEKKDKRKTLENVALTGASAEVVQRYGSAAKEHLVAYSGVDNETGMQLKKGLKDIAESKVNPENEYANLKQQAGFAAENKYTARENAERIINKDKTRVVNTDTKGSGSYNQLYDHYIIDKNGNIISAEQMKFVGNSPEACFKLLASKKFQKYIDADAKITVPSDYYDGVIKEADRQIAELEKKLEYAKANHTDQVENIQEKLNKYKKLRRSIKNSNVSTKEALFAKQHPKLSTATDIAKISHRAGLEQAKYGAAIGGTVSIIQNAVALCKGDIEINEAGIAVVKDTTKAAVTSYAIGAAGSALKGVMQNSGSSVVRSISKTNLPAALVTTAVEAGKTLKKYISGEIDGLECLEELGEKGTGMVSSAMFATAGQMLIPIPVVGATVGAMVGYALSSACYKVLVDSLKEARFAHEERLRIEKECAEVIKMLEEYRKEMNEVVNKYMTEHTAVFNSAFSKMEEAIGMNDIDGFISGANLITKKLGGKVRYNNFEEFNAFMESDEIDIL